MQAYEPQQSIEYCFKKYKKENMNFQKIKVFFNSKVKIFIKIRS